MIALDGYHKIEFSLNIHSLNFKRSENRDTQEHDKRRCTRLRRNLVIFAPEVVTKGPEGQ